MTNLDLTPIKNRLAKATPGPWRMWQDPRPGHENETAVETAWAHGDIEGETELITDYLPTRADARFIAEAPADIAALIGEVERLRRSGATLGLVIEKQCQAALDATGLHDLIDETGDGDWGAVWETVAEMGETCRRLRAQLDAVRALHVPVDANYYAATVKECCVCPGPWPCPTIRALGGEQG